MQTRLQLNSVARRIYNWCEIFVQNRISVKRGRIKVSQLCLCRKSDITLTHYPHIHINGFNFNGTSYIFIGPSRFFLVLLHYYSLVESHSAVLYIWNTHCSYGELAKIHWIFSTSSESLQSFILTRKWAFRKIKWNYFSSFPNFSRQFKSGESNHSNCTDKCKIYRVKVQIFLWFGFRWIHRIIGSSFPYFHFHLFM